MQWLTAGEHQVRATDDWLSEREREVLRGIRFTKRHREFLTRRWAAKRAVATVLDLSDEPTTLASIEIHNRPSGAPFVVIGDRAVALDVSLTDRAGWAVCLVGPPGMATAGTLGVDLELVEPRSERFVADYLTARECTYVLGLTEGDQRHAAANLLWSAKEAALKVMQIGLRADTRSVEVTLQHDARSDGWSAMTVTNAERTMPGWWRRDGAFVLTIAFAEPADPPTVLQGGADLAVAVPVHSWLEQPLVQRRSD